MSITERLSDPAVIKAILTRAGFSFKKSLGQNFLTDGSVCPEMAEDAAECGDSLALEIGPGIGVLTVELARRFERVVSVELDERLRPILTETLADLSNTEVVFGDAMKLDLAALIAERAGAGRAAVCANLPYYITSPLIMLLLESRLPISSVTVMVQKEAAERLCAEPGSREGGAVSVAVRYYSEPEILFEVPRSSFTPQPNVDSTVVRLVIRSQPPVSVPDEAAFFSFVRASFGQRRKTLINSLSALSHYSRENIRQALTELGIREDIRAEALDMSALAAVFGKLYSSGEDEQCH